MDKDTTPPIDPTADTQPKPSPTVVSIARKKARPSRPQDKRLHNGPKKFTLEEAFDFYYTPGEDDSVYRPLNYERAVRAVGFLLHWCSEMGNRDVCGVAANGLGHVLYYTADQLKQVKANYQREIEELRSKLDRKGGGQ
jgi:hypothetical protein